MKIDDFKIGIALSGGGVRAAVFHLGILGRLAEDELLEKITRISTVSGGTLVTGLVYSIAGNKWPTSDFFLTKCLRQTRYYLTIVKTKNKETLLSLGRFGFLTEPTQSVLLILNFTIKETFNSMPYLGESVNPLLSFKEGRT